jgi:hypothetical protein
VSDVLDKNPVRAVSRADEASVGTLRACRQFPITLAEMRESQSEKAVSDQCREQLTASFFFLQV